MRLSSIPVATRTAKPAARRFGFGGMAGGVASIVINDGPPGRAGVPPGSARRRRLRARGPRSQEREAYCGIRAETARYHTATVPNHDVIRIAGAGPSGLAAAIILARAGREVEVHEAKRDVGTRFIGDLQIIEGTSESESVLAFLDRLGIERNFYFRAADWATFYDHKNSARVIRSKEPYGWFIHRGAEEGTLDRGLLAQAQRAGAKVTFNSRLAADQADIVATGPASPDGLAKEMTWRSNDDERIDVYFNHKLSPGGYSYLFILDDVATFGCAIVADFKQIDSYFDHSLAAAQRLHHFDVPADACTGYSYMNFPLKHAATSNAARFVGEAAGFQDYLFGLGIRYALTSGSLAARSILEERDYDELWKSELGAKQQTSLVNRFLYESGGNFGLSMFVRQAARA